MTVQAITANPTFKGVEISIQDADGNKWVVANKIAEAQGYERPRTYRKLINQMTAAGDLIEGRHFKYLPMPTLSGMQETLCLSLWGVIRTTMRANAPRATEFRDWAEDVLHKVMTTGSYGMVPALPDDFKVTTDVMLKKLNKLNATVNTLAKEEQTWEATARREQYNWMTAAQFVQEEYDATGFNDYGRFDKFCAERHEAIYGRPPRIRRPALFSKRVNEECVYPRDQEHREFLKTLYRVWRQTYRRISSTSNRKEKPGQRKVRRTRGRHRLRAAASSRK